MSVRRSRREAHPTSEQNQQLMSTRALLIILIGVLAGVVVAVKPDLAVPIGMGVAVVTLLIVIIGS